MVYFLVLVVFVKVLVFFSEIGVVLVVFGSGGSETLNPTLEKSSKNPKRHYNEATLIL